MSTYPLTRVFLELTIGLQSEKLIDSVLHPSQVFFEDFLLASIRGVRLVADHGADLQQRFNT